MRDALGVANYFVPTAHDATDSPRGTGSDTESSRTRSIEAAEEATSRATFPGVVGNVTADAITPARSGLTDEQQTFLARIRNTRKQGYMLTMEDADILLGIIEELTKL